MYEITVDGGFSATHRLSFADGTVEPLHGHDWKVAVRLSAEALDRDGMVVDFATVRARLEEITARLHHTYLNDHPWFEGVSPTAERVARAIFDRLSPEAGLGPKVRGVTVTEAPGCRARYVPS